MQEFGTAEALRQGAVLGVTHSRSPLHRIARIEDSGPASLSSGLNPQLRTSTVPIQDSILNWNWNPNSNQAVLPTTSQMMTPPGFHPFPLAGALPLSPDLMQTTLSPGLMQMTASQLNPNPAIVTVQDTTAASNFNYNNNNNNNDVNYLKNNAEYDATFTTNKPNNARTSPVLHSRRRYPWAPLMKGEVISPPGMAHVCDVNKVLVDSPVPGEPGLHQSRIKAAYSDMQRVSWHRVEAVPCSDFSDARDQKPAIYTLGGDVGELILALNVFEKMFHAPLPQHNVSSIFAAWVQANAQKPLEFTIDATTAARIISKLNSTIAAFACVKLDFTCNKRQFMKAVVAELVLPENIASPYIRLLLEEPELMQTRPELTTAVLSEYINLMWSRAQLRDKATQPVLRNQSLPHNSAAAVEVQSPKNCNVRGVFPLLSTSLGGGAALTTYLYHSDAADYLRRLNAGFLAQVADRGTEFEQALGWAMVGMGRLHFETTMRRLVTGRNLSLYTLRLLG
eukprot:gnl/Spiro4/14547_TR7845_c0_g1_i1.p1 gnl/Spiro4/14547_TR7845_c0_g1~~gnl/Spiro4/14547_TR7845_c0_g1_i1.p1  ORF type:complete len:576 (+),score=125.75 gnl/Spiro4/14547_TR7845_c0_g1_i1:207-1730(+)